MTTIDITPCELAAPDARTLTDRIKVAVEATWDLIATAYTHRAWSALGYSSWDDYCTREFGTSRLRLPREERGEVVASLREQGLSIRAIASVTGDSRDTVHKALASGVRNLTPALAPGEASAIHDSLVDDELAGPTDTTFDEAAASAVESRVVGTDGKSYPTAVKRQPPKKEHPATYSDPILATIAAHLPATGTVLDPFAGTGRIHELATDERRTVGIEIEQEWADKHGDTIHGEAIETLEDMADDTFDAIATSPTYGNRMADHHNATDDSVRLTYKHTLGRDLTDGNSGAMQWGEEYRLFHHAAWSEAVRVLRPGGTFTINIKNHVRGDVVQRVAEWHITTLTCELGLELVALDVIPTRGLMAGANADTRTGHELVATFRKGDQS